MAKNFPWEKVSSWMCAVQWEWKIARQISKIPFIDEDEYGKEIISFKPELQLLGFIIDFGGNYQMVVDNILSSFLSSLTAEVLLFILDCMYHSTSPNKIATELESRKCLKTGMGDKNPGDCFFSDSEWCCLLQVFNSVPLIDHNFYDGRIATRKKWVGAVGVTVDFEEVVKVFVQSFKRQATLSSITRENGFSFLSCYRKLHFVWPRMGVDLSIYPPSFLTV